MTLCSLMEIMSIRHSESGQRAHCECRCTIQHDGPYHDGLLMQILMHKGMFFN